MVITKNQKRIWKNTDSKNSIAKTGVLGTIKEENNYCSKKI